jgi:hypothetical protein
MATATRLATRAAVAACIVAGGSVVGMSTAGADTVASTPAPPAVGLGSALQLGNILSIGGSGAAAGPNGAAAGAVPVAVLGHPLLGATQVGTGDKSGALVDTGATPLGRLQVAPYAVSVTQTATSRHAAASSAAARADIIDPNVLHIDVLQSSSSATHTGALSTGQSVSDGVVVRVGGPSGTVIRVLHSEADSNGHGRSYLLAVGDNAIGDENVVGAVCSLNMGPALNLACLNVTGGVGGLQASDLQAVVGGLNGLHASAITAGATGGPSVVGPGVSTGVPGVATNLVQDTTFAPHRSVVLDHHSGGLALTGQSVWLAVLTAIALMMLGAVSLLAAKLHLQPAFADR